MRLEAGEVFQRDVLELLSKSDNIVAVCENGTEHTHPQFVELLRSNDSPGSKFVRYAPDGVYLLKTGDVIHFDAKCGKSIEKDAYETYMALATLGCRVILFVKYSGVVYYQDVQKIKLIPGDETVAPFPIDRQLPVENGWIYPRKKRGFNQPGRMSGTPYREIDFTSMVKIEE